MAMTASLTPKTIYLGITNRCNLRCSYCYYHSSHADVRTELSTAQWLHFFKELKACSVLNVYLSGGEPLIRKDIKELIDGIVKNSMRFTIITNATLATDHIADHIKSTKRCDQVQVSIDADSPEQHDIFRGKGSFEKALTGIKILIKNNITVTARVTIHKYNVYSLNRIADFLLEDVGVTFLRTNSAIPMGLCSHNKENIQLTAAEYSIAMSTLLDLEKKYAGRVKATAGPLATAKHWSRMEQHKAELNKNKSGGYLGGCNCIFDSLGVLADGTIVPCEQLGHIKLGVINQDNLKDIWLNHSELKLLRKRGKISLKDFTQCKDCEYVQYCQGACPATAYAEHGIENHPSSEGCYKKFIEQGGFLPK
jgi:SynChlorMet cassette radical SAM/SPASM protein ScmE